MFSYFHEKIEFARKLGVNNINNFIFSIFKLFQQLYKISNVIYSSKSDCYQEFYTKLEHFYNFIKDIDESSYKKDF